MLAVRAKNEKVSRLVLHESNALNPVSDSSCKQLESAYLLEKQSLPFQYTHGDLEKL